MVDENEIILNDTNVPERTPRRRRTSHKNMIGIFMYNMPDDKNKRRNKENNRK